MTDKRPQKGSRPEYKNRRSQTGWPILFELIPPLPEHAKTILENLPLFLEEVWPLKGKHRRQLYRDIRDLSGILTSHRAEMKRSYWLKPGFISAYMYYFLPWNLVRLTRLLSGLELIAPKMDRDLAPLLLDLGSGPLTLPIALWLAKPEWRQLPLWVLATDSISKPLELGAALFRAIAGQLGGTEWKILREQASVFQAPGKATRIADKFRLNPWLLCATNMLNELNPARTDSDEEEKIAEDIEATLLAWRAFMKEDTRLLLVEPGTRLGGTTIMEYRRAAMDLGLRPLAPCTHDKFCPLLRNESSSLSKTWCHFIFSAQDAPDWLKSLSRKAGLFKSSLSLSCLLIGPPTPARESKAYMQVRIVSRPFPVDEKICRYGCAACGLCLLPGSQSLISGSLTAGKVASPQKDAKSGASILGPAKESLQ